MFEEKKIFPNSDLVIKQEIQLILFWKVKISFRKTSFPGLNPKEKDLKWIIILFQKLK